LSENTKTRNSLAVAILRLYDPLPVSTCMTVVAAAIFSQGNVALAGLIIDFHMIRQDPVYIPNLRATHQGEEKALRYSAF